MQSNSHSVNMSLTIQTTISDFPEFIRSGSYYVDKTLLIRDIIANERRVCLYARPRRFGKSLNQSMLCSFFNLLTAEEYSRLFDGLAISSEREICEMHQGKYPVIKLSFASVVGGSLDDNLVQMARCIRNGLAPYYPLFAKLEAGTFAHCEDVMRFFNSPVPSMLNTDILLQATELLHDYYGKKCVVLLDEYDVPLQTAFQRGYYDLFMHSMRALMTSTFKDNANLQYGIITGCLKIAKESIFTGFNNPYVNTILTDDGFGERFGFTQDEVDGMLEACNLMECRELVREWYDGYRFGKTDVYNPYSVACFLAAALRSSDNVSKPLPYWANTSGNDIIRDLLMSDKTDETFRKMQLLLEGRTVKLPVAENTVYRDFESSPETLWSTMLFTGYLKPAADSALEGGLIALEIPNREVAQIIEAVFLQWMRRELHPVSSASPLLEAFVSGDVEKVEEEFSRQMRLSISCRDCSWNFYPAFLQGLLTAVAGPGYSIVSNREIGEGIPDILIKANNASCCVIIEIKSCKEPDMLSATLDSAIRQFKERGYGEDEALNEQFDVLYGFAIACSRKQCMVKSWRLNGKSPRK